MTKLDELNINIYPLDTIEYIKRRIASVLNTVPKYIYFPDGTPSLSDISLSPNSIEFDNLLDTIKSYDNFDELYENIKDKLQQTSLNIVNDILIPFIIYNKTLIDIDDNTRGFILLGIQTEIDSMNIFEENPNITQIWENRRREQQKIEDEITKNRKISDEYTDIFSQFDNIRSDVKYTDFEIEKTVIEFVLSDNTKSITDIFNNIRLTKYIPYASVNNTFKLYRDFIPYEDWNMSFENIILLKLFKFDNEDIKHNSDYLNAVITIENNTIKVITEIEKTKNVISVDVLQKRLQDIFVSDVVDLPYNETKVNGLFLVPKFELSTEVLLDLITNDVLYYSMMYVDESDKISKKKSGVYVYFNHPTIGKITANIIPKISEKGDNDLLNKDVVSDFKYGTQYVRVKITNAKSSNSVKEFQNILSKLLYLYREKYTQVKNYYSKFIPNFIKKLQRRSNVNVRAGKLKDIAPEVFIAGYPPKCTHQPNIIPDEDVETAIAQGKKVMKYPLVTTNGIIPRNYICNYEDAKYPALRDNPLSNNDRVKYLPCCYTKDHTNKEGSIFRHYYFGEPLSSDDKSTSQQDMIVTNKFVKSNTYGVLPSNIETIFKYYGQTSKMTTEFCIRNVSENIPDKKHKRTSGKRCYNWKREELLEIILEKLKIDIPNDDELDSLSRNKWVELRSQPINKLRKVAKEKKYIKKYINENTSDDTILYLLFWGTQNVKIICEFIQKWFDNNNLLTQDDGCGKLDKVKV